MARVVFMDLVDHVSGKYCKQDPNGAIFARRKDTNTKYVYHVHSPFAGEPSAAQLAGQNRFKQAQVKVKEVMSDPMELATATAEWQSQTKYKTLRGYLFQREYAKLVAGA